MPDTRCHAHLRATSFCSVIKRKIYLYLYLPDIKHDSAAGTQRLVCVRARFSAPASCNSWLLLPQLTQITNGEVCEFLSHREKALYLTLSTNALRKMYLKFK